jgi:hypothetical protein
MRPDDIRKLLGGYATGTLTEEERRALFEAALTDQDLFNELNREQALQELIADPAARRELLRALPESERPRFSLGWRWAIAGGLAAAALVAIVVVRSNAPQQKVEPVLVAQRQELPAAPEPQPEVKAPQPAAAPARQEAVAKQDAAAAPPARPVEVTAEAAPMQMSSSEKSASVDALQPRDAPLKDRSALGVVQFAARAPSQASIIPYRILRGSVEGGYTEVDPQTVFQAGDRVRVVFESLESGRLRVTSGGAGAKVLLDAPATSGGTYNLDVPPEEQKLVVTFSRDQGAAPVTVEIPIRRQSSLR